MIKGGYAMIDCKGLNLLGGSTPQTISGIYAESLTAITSGKAIFAHNCIYGNGHDMSPVAVMGQIESEDTVIFTASILQIIVKNDDTVTIESLITNSNRTTTKK